MNKNGRQTGSGRVVRRSVDGFMATTSVPRPVRRASAPNPIPAASPAVVAPGPIPAAEPVKAFPLPQYVAPKRPTKPLRKRTSKKMLALRAVSLLLAVFLMTGGFLAWQGFVKFHKVFHGTTTVAALTGKTVAPTLLKGEGDGRVNILLLGIGGPGHDGPDLTDTMVVLSVDPVNDTASMVSIPRDLWVRMPVNYFGSSQKINAAYESGKYNYLGHMDDSSANANAVQAGFAADDQVVKDVLDININYHVLVDFQAFRQAVDTVGGVSVNVPTALVDPTMAWENNNNPVLAEPGVQTMDGVKALQYARSRETTSDFARTERQRQILIALKDKVMTAGTLSNPAKIDGLLNAFGDNVYSDLSTQGAMRLVGIMRQVGDNKISSVSLVDQGHQLVTTDRVGSLSVVRPVAGFNNYADIQAYIRSQLPDGYIVKEHAGIAVEGATSSSASAAAALLTGYGYTVVSTATATQPVTKPVLVDLSHGKDPYTLHYLEQRYAVTALTALPAGSTAPTTAKFAIITP